MMTKLTTQPPRPSLTGDFVAELLNQPFSGSLIDGTVPSLRATFDAFRSRASHTVAPEIHRHREIEYTVRFPGDMRIARVAEELIGREGAELLIRQCGNFVDFNAHAPTVCKATLLCDVGGGLRIVEINDSKNRWSSTRVADFSITSKALRERGYRYADPEDAVLICVAMMAKGLAAKVDLERVTADFINAQSADLGRLTEEEIVLLSILRDGAVIAGPGRTRPGHEALLCLDISPHAEELGSRTINAARAYLPGGSGNFPLVTRN
jgi:hypothetical protein